MESHEVKFLMYERSSSLELGLRRGISQCTLLALPAASPAQDIISEDPLNIAVPHSDVGL